MREIKRYVWVIIGSVCISILPEILKLDLTDIRYWIVWSIFFAWIVWTSHNLFT